MRKNKITPVIGRIRFSILGGNEAYLSVILSETTANTYLRIRCSFLSFLSVLFTLSVSSVQFSCSVASNSLWLYESQHARPPCPSPTPGVHSDSCASSPWCHPAISSSVVPFSFCPQSLPASGSFPMSQLFAWGGPSIGVSASASVLPINTRTDFP